MENNVARMTFDHSSVTPAVQPQHGGPGKDHRLSTTASRATSGGSLAALVQRMIQRNQAGIGDRASRLVDG